MAATRVLDSREVELLSDWDGLIGALETAHRELASGALVQPQPLALRDARDDSSDAPAVVPMMALDLGRGLFVVKVLADRPRNRAAGLPAQQSTVSLYDVATGECLGLIDGAALTRRRTAAATALATRALAREDARSLALIGAGALAVEHARAIARVRELREVRVWSRSPERAAAAVARIAAEGISAVVSVGVRDAVQGADVVCTLTPSPRPILDAGSLEPGVHVNAVGSPPRPAYSELDPAALAAADLVVVDSRSVALADSGNIRNAIAEGALDPDHLVELGELLGGSRRGRASDSGITVFNSVGVGIQDLAAAALVVDRARDLDRGIAVEVRALGRAAGSGSRGWVPDVMPRGAASRIPPGGWARWGSNPRPSD